MPASGWVVPDATPIERRLAGAVLAEQGVHLAGQHLERDVGQGGDAAVALGDAGQHHRRRAPAVDRCLRASALSPRCPSVDERWSAVRGTGAAAGGWPAHRRRTGRYLSSAAWSSAGISADR